MKGDKAARKLDRLVEAFFGAAAHRAALGLPSAMGELSKTEGGALASWLVSEEGGTLVKATLSALKAERVALKALAKFGRKMSEAAQAPKAATAAPVEKAPVRKTAPVPAPDKTEAPRKPARPSPRTTLSLPPAVDAKPNARARARGGRATPEAGLRHGRT